MNPRLIRSTGRLGTVGALVLAGCAHDRTLAPQDGSLTDPGPLSATEATVLNASNRFGFELLREVHRHESEPNLLLSPLSVSMALGMALNGAVGPTYDAMRATLGFGGLSETEVNQAYATLVARLSNRDPNVEFKLANSAWYERSFPVRSEFLDLARIHFDARVSALDFLDPASPGVINSWVEEATGGRIRDLVDRIDALDRIFLVNAVYFKAPWTDWFTPEATADRPFRTHQGREVAVPTMVRDYPFHWFRDDRVEAVELLYADSAFSMVVVAPTDGRPLESLIDDLTPERWQGWMDRFERNRVMLFMPRFRFEYGVSLQQPLERMGMGIAFQPRVADFTRIAPVDDLHISRVEHKTFIDVHERGTEAAAATSVVGSITSMPPTLHFDRPFLFAIRERETGTLLFVGTIGQP